MKSTHCILYNFIDNDYRNLDETGGTCLDAHDSDGNCLSCMDTIAKGACCKNRKTPVL